MSVSPTRADSNLDPSGEKEELLQKEEEIYYRYSTYVACLNARLSSFYNLINYFCSRVYRFIFITIMAVVLGGCGEEKKCQDFADIIIQKSPLWEIGVLPCGAVEVDQKELKSRRLNSPLVQVFNNVIFCFIESKCCLLTNLTSPL